MNANRLIAIRKLYFDKKLSIALRHFYYVADESSIMTTASLADGALITKVSLRYHHKSQSASLAIFFLFES